MGTSNSTVGSALKLCTSCGLLSRVEAIFFCVTEPKFKGMVHGGAVPLSPLLFASVLFAFQLSFPCNKPQ